VETATNDVFSDIGEFGSSLDEAIRKMQNNASKVQAAQKGSVVKVSNAEFELLQNYESASSMMMMVVMKDDQKYISDGQARTALLKLFGGEGADRINRIKAIVNGTKLSEARVNDQRKQRLLNACDSVMKILHGIGLGFKIPDLNRMDDTRRSLPNLSRVGTSAEEVQAVATSSRDAESIKTLQSQLKADSEDASSNPAAPPTAEPTRSANVDRVFNQPDLGFFTPRSDADDGVYAAGAFDDTSDDGFASCDSGAT